MTENEALKSALKKVIAQEKSNWGYIENFDVDENWAVRTAIEQVQQYRKIGSVEECREAVEKQTAKRPRIIGNAMICPSCPRCFKSASPTYCPSCGQMIDWGNEE